MQIISSNEINHIRRFLDEQLEADIRLTYSASPNLTSLIKQGNDSIEDPVWEYLRFLDD